MSDISAAMFHLLGCGWGRAGVWTKDDSDQCKKKATRLMQFHHPADVDNASEVMKFCDVHAAKIESMSTPTDKARLEAWKQR